MLEKERMEDKFRALLVAADEDALLDVLFANASKLPKAFNNELSVTQQRT